MASMVFAQQEEEEEFTPIKWKSEVEKPDRNLSKDEKIKLFLTAEIEKGWHLYALERIEGGPIATKIALVENPFFKAENIIAPPPIEKDDAAFGVTTKFYEDSVKFTLPLIAKENLTGKSSVDIKIRYQTCNDQMCLPPKTLLIEIDIKAEK